MKNLILLKNSLVEFPLQKYLCAQDNRRLIGTLVSNLLYYGYILSKDTYEKVSQLSDGNLKIFWANLEPTLKQVTGANKEMGKYVVYQNFPKEVLDKTNAEYWVAQILMYWGLPNQLFTTEEVKRDAIFEKTTLKVLQIAQGDALGKILDTLFQLPARWTTEQLGFVNYLVVNAAFPEEINVAKIPFKENLIAVVLLLMEKDILPKMSSAMDVLRLAVGLSGGDVTLKTNTKFISLPRKHRRFLCRLLENTSNLEEDVARKPEVFKRLFRSLHPGDFNFTNVLAVYNILYNNNAQSFNGRIEELLKGKNKQGLELLQSRPGDFMRRLNQCIKVYGIKAVNSFNEIAPRLTIIQLLKISKYLETTNLRKNRTFAPKGNWTKLQVVENKNEIPEKFINKLVKNIDQILVEKLEKFGSVNLDGQTDLIKLQNNDSELLPYGRGTTFLIPSNMKFIRSASYWKHKTAGGYNNWFDNGWNLFDSDWKNLGAVCWSHPKYPSNGYGRNKTEDTGAIFSGDPTNSKTSDGKACQMIDLYPDKLLRAGVRYAVWNILCYSKIKFCDAEEVFAALQWGEEPQKGELFEPSRCQISFPLTGDSFTKYVAYIDLKERKLVYLDANLKASTTSAVSNGQTLSEKMPAFLEYIDTLPSIYDLFRCCGQSDNGIPILYSDKEVKIDKRKKNAYVFRSENESNKFEQLNINNLLK